MCDTSNSALGAILGQRVNKQPHVIAYALDNHKFRSYLLGSKIIVFSNHTMLKFLLKKPE
ncbi:hypothetical protein CR513_52226, partial [Mucuna pruriens]